METQLSKITGRWIELEKKIIAITSSPPTHTSRPTPQKSGGKSRKKLSEIDQKIIMEKKIKDRTKHRKNEEILRRIGDWTITAQDIRTITTRKKTVPVKTLLIVLELATDNQANKQKGKDKVVVEARLWVAAILNQEAWIATLLNQPHTADWGTLYIPLQTTAAHWAYIKVIKTSHSQAKASLVGVQKADPGAVTTEENFKKLICIIEKTTKLTIQRDLTCLDGTYPRPRDKHKGDSSIHLIDTIQAEAEGRPLTGLGNFHKANDFRFNLANTILFGKEDRLAEAARRIALAPKPDQQLNKPRRPNPTTNSAYPPKNKGKSKEPDILEWELYDAIKTRKHAYRLQKEYTDGRTPEDADFYGDNMAPDHTDLDKLRVASINIAGGLGAKLYSLIEYMTYWELDALAIQETWLKPRETEYIERKDSTYIARSHPLGADYSLFIASSQNPNKSGRYSKGTAIILKTRGAAKVNKKKIMRDPEGRYLGLGLQGSDNRTLGLVAYYGNTSPLSDVNKSCKSLEEFRKDLEAFKQQYAEGISLIYAGDINVVESSKLDRDNPPPNSNPTPQQEATIKARSKRHAAQAEHYNLITNTLGARDTFRARHPDKVARTWTRKQECTRKKHMNQWARLDQILACPKAIAALRSTGIERASGDVRSDHSPVIAEFSRRALLGFTLDEGSRGPINPPMPQWRIPPLTRTKKKQDYISESKYIIDKPSYIDKVVGDSEEAEAAEALKTSHLFPVETH
jgi:exonuclease III